ncbi:aminotransferase DegT [Vibrio cidicii]|uniref:Aminotransferase DegT n=1 Tax=Vibrio cidicii TaxID=1763883 RepID=A0ABR5W2U9_9VIBR|nr:DegT/DnrJ/EryC1/StrS family aminotransferase [Vibrio cidicii]KYN86708.1 aminotransferase DegT [Vibrio cidicii]
MTIKLNQPLTPNLDKVADYISQIHNCGWYTNFGPLHQLLTQKLEAYLGVENLLLVSNGTVALQVACKVLGIERAISTPFSFAATSSALLWQGVDLSYCDIEADSYNISLNTLETALTSSACSAQSIQGVVATHVYGNPCNVEAIESLAQQHQIKVIYDAAHAFGVKVDGKSVLNFGDASTLSFHATKVFHTVEGGAIIFKCRSDFEKAKELINFGIDAKGRLGPWGINGKLNEYQCAVGLALLDDIDTVLTHRVKLFERYRRGLQGIVEMPEWYFNASYNGAYMPIFVDEIDQVHFQKTLESQNIQFRRYFTPSLDLAYPDQKSFGCSVSHDKAKGAYCLPLHAYMTENEVDRVVLAIRSAITT